jgi:formylglycine-generating enzyme required for sulfatase activity
MKHLRKPTWRLAAGIGMLLAVVIGVWVWDVNRVKPLGTKRVDLGNGVTMDFVWIPPGEFIMGSPTNEVGREVNETQHRVKITKGFWMGKYEVTQKQYAAVMGTNPSVYDLGGSYPVDNVSWDDAVAFCAKMKARTGLELRLPTGSEWEYACRAGTTTAYYTGDTEADLARSGCFDRNAWRGIKIWKWGRKRFEPRRVGCFEPNAWGVYDMHGNIYEWCADWYGEYPTGTVADPMGPETGEFRVVRGGSWRFDAQFCRSANSSINDPSARDTVFGFRCALSR